jgi:hypothetical protein
VRQELEASKGIIASLIEWWCTARGPTVRTGGRRTGRPRFDTAPVQQL